jgi:hypothetical protein
MLFCSIVFLANQTGIDLQAVDKKKMDLKSVRDKDRHKTTINSNNLSTINYEPIG